jgi:GTP cyclohydrolase I
VKTGSKAGLVTSIVTGVFKENLSTRNEAMQLIGMSNNI